MVSDQDGSVEQNERQDDGFEGRVHGQLEDSVPPKGARRPVRNGQLLAHDFDDLLGARPARLTRKGRVKMRRKQMMCEIGLFERFGAQAEIKGRMNASS